MEKYLQILKKCPLFLGIEDESLLKMLHCLGAVIRRYEKKHIIIEEGKPTKNIGIVLSGSANVVQIDYFGNRSILKISEPSDVFAEAFACAETKSVPVCIVANEMCDIMLIDCSHILHTCSNNCQFHQQLIYNLMKNLAVNTISFHQKIAITSKRTTREKLMEYLKIQSQKTNKKTFTIPFDRQELADYLEVDRSGLSSEISKLKKDGIIDSYKNKFTLL